MPITKIEIKLFLWGWTIKNRASLDDDYLCHVAVGKTEIAWVGILITNRVSMYVQIKTYTLRQKLVQNYTWTIQTEFWIFGNFAFFLLVCDIATLLPWLAKSLM